MRNLKCREMNYIYKTQISGSDVQVYQVSRCMEYPGVWSLQVYQLGFLVANNGNQLWKLYWKFIESLFGRIVETSKDSKEHREPDLEMDSKQDISRRLGRQPPKEHLLLGAIWSGQKWASTFSVSYNSTDFSVYFYMS